MRIHLTPRTIAVIAAAAAALGAAGCATTTAAARSSAHGRATVILRDVSRQLARTTSLTVAIDVRGAQDMAMHADLTMRTAPDKAMTAEMTMMGHGSVVATMREILVGKTFYLSAPQDLMPWAAPGKPWTAVPVSMLDQAPGGTHAPTAGASLAQLNPASLFSDTLTAISASKNVSVAGTERIDGVPTTRLHGTYRDQGTVITFDLWADAHARPRELRASTPQSDPAQVGSTMTIHCRSFNMPVSITPPPAREVGPPQSSIGQ
jgi:hypothetical protein